jgi:D-sedoheptulose 7-phosphate isomerase
MTVRDSLAAEARAHVRAIEESTEQCGSQVAEITAHLVQCFREGNKLLLCGNGGSAADAQHIAAELVNRYRRDRPGLPALALTTDTSVLTSVGNDRAFGQTFTRQVEALAQRGDVVVGLSTSGRSPNVLRALDAARARGALAIGFTGAGGGESMAPHCDHLVIVPSAETPRIQECHEFLWHAICGMVERELFGEPAPAAETGGRGADG